MKRKKLAFVTALGALVILFFGFPALAPAQEGREIIGRLSNFDVYNTDRASYNDLELHLIGRIDPDCIKGWYPGWGAPPKLKSGTPFGQGVTVVWANPNDPIEPRRNEHFGLHIGCDDRYEVRGVWSMNGRRVREIPVPWQFWETGPGVVRDIIRLPRELEAAPMSVRRAFVTLPERLPLKALIWNEVDNAVHRMGRRWTPVDRNPKEILPGRSVVLKIPVRKADSAVLVRYEVLSRGRVISRFINEAILAPDTTSQCYPELPTPQLSITGTEDYTGSDGNAYTRYRMTVANRADFPDELFAPAPDLPPCGLNSNASRTWVDIYTGDDVRLYGFCALSDSDGLDGIWFAVPRGQPPPDCVYITLNDRRCDQTYKSNCVSTSGLGPECVEFEEPPLGTEYHVGDTFSDSGVMITVIPFQWSSGTWTNGGHAKITNAGDAGGTGQEVWVNNVNLAFNFAVNPNVLFLNFGEFGGNVNIEINGDLRNVANFADIHATTIGTVDVSVTNGFGADMGTLMLTGEIHSFSIGGQEFVIDHVCITEVPPVDATGVWIMPYGIGGTRLDRIDPNGLTNYTDWISGFDMVDAPFGGRLGFRLGSANVIPTADITYYRLQHKHESESGWHEFNETVRVHYVKEAPAASPVFPTFKLGPHDVDGKKLYLFQPHEADLPSLVPLDPGETAKWPKTGFIGDIYRGFLNTEALHLAPGKHQIKLEVFDSTGTQTLPGAGTFRFVVPTGVKSDGEIETDYADAGSIDAGGFVFTVHVDNRKCGAVIDEPMIGAVGAGDCGFLRYDPAAPPLIPPVNVAFHATHPDNRALFTFRMWRGPNRVSIADIIGAETSASAGGTVGNYGVAYTGDGNGNFSRPFSRAELLEACLVEAAFSQNLHVFAKATNGWHHRINKLDARAVRAFALTPE